MKNLKPALIAIFSLIMFGCKSIPDALQVKSEDELTNFVDFKKAEQVYSDSIARWVGKIASVHAKDENALVLVEYYSDSSTNRPIKERTDEKEYFAVSVRGIKEMSEFQVGRLITVLGEPQKSPLENIPLLDPNAIHLWVNIRNVPYDQSGLLAISDHTINFNSNITARSPFDTGEIGDLQYNSIPKHKITSNKKTTTIVFPN